MESTDPPPNWAQVPGNIHPNPTPATNRCQVIPADGEPPCTQPGRLPQLRKGDVAPEERAAKILLCEDHRDEHQTLYLTHKAAGHLAKMLKRKVKRECNAPASDEAGWDREKLDEMIATRDEYDKAITDELEKRGSHQRRFYAEVDSGHNGWLWSLRRDQDDNAVVLARLRQRRDALVAEAAQAQAAEEKKRQDAQRLRLEAEQTERQEIAEAQRRANEEAQRIRREEAQRRAIEEAERTRLEAAQRHANEEAQRIRREEAQRRAIEEAQRRANEEAQRIRREEAQRIRREEAQRIRREEAQRRADEEAQRIRQEEAERTRREAAQRRDEAERIRKAMVAQRRRAAREEEVARQRTLEREAETRASAERHRRREAEEENVRRALATTHETRPLLDNAGQPSQPSTLYPQVPIAARIQPYGSRASPQGVDVERQDAAVRPEIEAEPCLRVFDVCFMLVFGVAVFFIFVKLVG